MQETRKDIFWYPCPQLCPRAMVLSARGTCREWDPPVLAPTSAMAEQGRFDNLSIPCGGLFYQTNQAIKRAFGALP